MKKSMKNGLVSFCKKQSDHLLTKNSPIPQTMTPASCLAEMASLYSSIPTNSRMQQTVRLQTREAMLTG